MASTEAALLPLRRWYFIPVALLLLGLSITTAADNLVNVSRLKMFVDDLPDMPKLRSFRYADGVAVSTPLKIGMFQIDWKFHRDLPPTPVFAYGRSRSRATVPGPTIEALHGIAARVTWLNFLPAKHILPSDRTIPSAVPPGGRGVPTVVHLHGGLTHPASDGSPDAWFTANYRHRGPAWANKTYLYLNAQHPGNLWYHDHAMGLTRVNILAGLAGAYVIRDPAVERRLGLPAGSEFDRHLIVSDRSFRRDGSIYMNGTGNNPSIHPQWQPEYFGDAIIVNGKAWPRLFVRRRKYRLRFINASNARFFRFFFSNGLRFTHLGSDSAYIKNPVTTNRFLLSPSEIADVVVDFAESPTTAATLCNNAAYPFPGGDAVTDENRNVMKFIVGKHRERDRSRVPPSLINYPSADPSRAAATRYITMYEYTTADDEPTHLYLNGLSFNDPVTETPAVGSSEVWSVINLTDDNHPLHVHLGLFVVLDQTALTGQDEFKNCMTRLNDAMRCHVERHARGRKEAVPAQERGWKNTFKMRPGFVTRILLRFAPIHSPAPYPFNATAAPGYAYHCHILDHEDNLMMRPLKLVDGSDH